MGHSHTFNTWAALPISLLLVACAAITGYDPTSYKTATDLKVEALLLIEKAQDPPGPHAAEIQAMRLRLRQAYEYEKGKGERNRFTRDQWQILADPKGSLLGGFLKKWQTENKGQSPAFLDGVSENVSAAFDKIIELESRKVKD
jgi:hypothetical protein